MCAFSGELWGGTILTGRRFSTLQHFCVSKDTFWFLLQKYGKYFEKQDTRLRRAVSAAKRLAIVLHWLAHTSSFSEFSQLAQRCIHFM